jgi:hypothetical protein
MHKPLTYALLLAATLGLAACDKASENKAEDAQESAQDAQESMQDSVEESNDAAQERAEENMDDRESPVVPITPPPADQ